MGLRVRRSSIGAAVAAVAVIGVVAVLCSGSAYASRIVNVASQVSIKSQHNTTFTGRVTSHAGCEDGRTVTLYTAGKQKLGTVKTNKNGFWKIKVSGFTGISLRHFFAKVAKFSNGAAGTIYVCLAATSKTIAF